MGKNVNDHIITKAFILTNEITAYNSGTKFLQHFTDWGFTTRYSPSQPY